jgi:hypothetical protein
MDTVTYGAATSALFPDAEDARRWFQLISGQMRTLDEDAPVGDAFAAIRQAADAEGMVGAADALLDYVQAETSDPLAVLRELVFAHELRCLRTQRSAQDATAFVKDHREAGAYYTKTAVDPGLAELEQELKALGLTFTAGEKAAAQAQATALNVGKKLSGYPEKLKQLAGAQQQPDLSMVPLNGEFPWAGYTWKLTFLEMRYKVTASKKRETSRAEGKSIEGTPAQIKKTAGAFKDPPDLTSMSVGDEFSWEGASWVLATAQQYSEIVVVKRDQ